MSGPASTTVTQVAASVSSVTLLASNQDRYGATFYNDSDKILYLKFGATASTSSYSVQVAPGGYFELHNDYAGQLDGIWESGVTGNVLVTEILP